MKQKIFKKYKWIILVGIFVLVLVTIQGINSIFTADSRTDEEIVESVYIPDRNMEKDLYFVTLEKVEMEYKASQEESIRDETEIRKLLEQAFNLTIASDYSSSLERFQTVGNLLDIPSIRNNIGVLYILTGEYERAQEAYKSVFELDPNYDGTYFNLGLLLDSQNRLEEAAQLFERSSLDVAQEQLATITEELAKDSHEQELEPNENANQATTISLNSEIDGAIRNLDDQDFYFFEMPKTHRDIVQVRLENKAPQLIVALRFLDSNKKYLGVYQTENSAENLEFSFSGMPNDSYYIHVFTNSFLTEEMGNYSLSVIPMSAYDEYESNNDILNAYQISIGSVIEAGIMDEDDQDFYTFSTSDDAKNIRILVENHSSELWPILSLYDSKKNRVEQIQADNMEADIEYSYSVTPNSTYFIQISGANSYLQGDYKLKITTEEG